ncbi:MAG: DNRLRE domain-containing protein [Chloroflexi bacterium]|nr:DNRLRE domain-containing protein [Chloroflexota bacterium]
MMPTFSRNTKKNSFPTMLLVVVSVIVLVVLVVMNRFTTAQANMPDIGYAEARYPNIVGTKLDSCMLCHTSSVPSLNSYGQAYKSAGRNSSALASIENQDTDNDGFTNLQEIVALTFPGDPGDHPVLPSPTPTRVPPTATSLPPTPTSKPTQPPQPTATNTSVPPTPTSGATQPPHPTSTATVPPTPANTPTEPPQPTTTVTPIPPTPTPPPQTASSLTFSPEADAYTSSDQHSANFGTLAELKSAGKPIQRSYLRFDVSGIGGNSINKAILRIYVDSSNAGAGFFVRSIANNTWVETTITYDNAPAYGKILAMSGPIRKSGWISVDVTRLIKGDGLISMVLNTPGNSYETLASRESGSNSPQLVITLRQQNERQRGDDTGQEEQEDDD